MSKAIVNLKYKNSKVSFKDTVIEFDKDGFAVIDDKYADSIISLDGYSLASSKNSEKTSEKVKSEEDKFDSMTVKQLLRYASNNNIDLKGATNKEEILKVFSELK